MIQHRSIFLSQQMLDVFLMLSVVGAAINCLIFSFAVQHVKFFQRNRPGLCSTKQRATYVQRRKTDRSLRRGSLQNCKFLKN